MKDRHFLSPTAGKGFADSVRVMLPVLLATGSGALLLSYLLGNIASAPLLMAIAAVLVSVLTLNPAAAICTTAIAGGLLLLFSRMEGMRSTYDPVQMLIALPVLAAIALCAQLPLRHMTNKARILQKQNEQDRMLNEINRRLLSIRGSSEINLLTLESLCEFLGKPGAMYAPGPDGTLQSICKVPRWLIAYPSELEAATKAFALGQRTGLGTDWFGASSFIHFPIQHGGETLAIASIRFGFERYPDTDMFDAIALVLSQAAIAMAREKLAAAHHKALLGAEREKMRSDFLQAISHDLRTPLTGILSASSTLLGSFDRFDQDTALSLISDIEQEAGWLLQMVENLLSITRVADGVSSLSLLPEAVEEVIWDAVGRIRKRYPVALISVSLPDDALIAPMDARLIVQVLMNILENAIKYGGDGDAVRLCAVAREDDILFSITDQGEGLPQDVLATLFTAGVALENRPGHGLGIGLAICKSIIQAHGGEIWGGNEKPRGACFCFTLPKEDA